MNDYGFYTLIGLGASGIVFAVNFILGWVSKKGSDSIEPNAVFPEKLRRLAVQDGYVPRKSATASTDGVLPMTLAFGAGYLSNMDQDKIKFNPSQGDVHFSPDNSSHSNDDCYGGGDSHDSSGACSDSSSSDGGGVF